MGFRQNAAGLCILEDTPSPPFKVGAMSVDSTRHKAPRFPAPAQAFSLCNARASRAWLFQAGLWASGGPVEPSSVPNLRWAR